MPAWWLLYSHQISRLNRQNREIGVERGSKSSAFSVELVADDSDEVLVIDALISARGTSPLSK